MAHLGRTSLTSRRLTRAMLPQGNSATMGYLGTSLLSHSSMTPRSENSKPSDATKDTTRASVESAGSRSAVARSTRSEVEPVLSDIPEGVQGLFSGAMPKEEIGALKLLQKNPTYDGRGTVIAIFDSGVDPGAPGLQVTSDGKPKVLDVIDCTGSGDVDMSKTVKLSDDGTIEGLNGVKLEVNPDWTNPSGEWRVGYKRVYQLFTSTLRDRITKERRKAFEKKQQAAVREAVAALAAAEQKGAEKKEKAELEARIKMLEEMMEGWKDEGPMIHCVVWHDGDKWRAALDTRELHPEGSGLGNLRDFKPLTNFRDERKFGTFSALDSNNFALNIYQEGKVLSIVTDASPHGTHVAAIAAANHPEDSSLNGVAPGAQVISCKIGDTRLGSMETIVGLSRALAACRQHGVDIINMSYGEATALPNRGRFIDLADDIVHKHGVIFVSSAGNAGPALSTVGAPGGTSSAIISVGAYVSPSLASAGHSAREALNEGRQYTWSSRGPTADGHCGITLSAPGGAIASVPQWTQQARQLMNGTSMASPNACGGIALVVSGLKQLGQCHSPARVRRALENTCEELGEGVGPWVLTSGRGMIRVDKAMEYLEKSDVVDQPDFWYDVKVRRTDSQGGWARGLYLRDACPTASVEATVLVEPRLHEDADTVSERCAIEDRIKLVSTAEWLTAPGVIMVPHGGRNFSIKVDADSLQMGLNYAEVMGFDALNEWRGPVFRVPVTAILPDECASNGRVDLGLMHFTDGAEFRHFVTVPEGASHAELKLTAVGDFPPRHFLVRLTEILPKTRYSDTETRKMVSLGSQPTGKVKAAVDAGATLEVTIAQYWLSQGIASLRAELSFSGLCREPAGKIHLDGSGGGVPVKLRALLGSCKVDPSAKLTSLLIPVRPTEATIKPYSDERDAMMPGDRIMHQMVLTYSVSIAEPGDFTVRLPPFNSQVYDGVTESQLLMVHDSNRRTLLVSDIYPEKVELAKGDHTVRVELRHESPAVLEKHRDLTLVLERKLGSAVDVPVYPDPIEMATGGKTYKGQDMHRAERQRVVVGLPAADKLPKDASEGRVLVGHVQWGTSDEPIGKDEIRYVVPPAAKKKDGDSKKGSEKEKEGKKSKDKELKEALRDAKVKFMGGLDTTDKEQRAVFETVATEVLKEFPGHIPVLLEALNAAEKRASGAHGAVGKGEDLTKEQEEHLSDVVAAAKAVLDVVDLDKVAIWAAKKCKEDDEKESPEGKALEEQKSAAIDALHKKAAAVMALHESGKATVEEVDASMGALRDWVDTAEDGKYLLLNARWEMAHKRPALALKSIAKKVKEETPPKKEVLEMRVKALQELGWTHWASKQRSEILDRFPESYPLF